MVRRTYAWFLGIASFLLVCLTAAMTAFVADVRDPEHAFERFIRPRAFGEFVPEEAMIDPLVLAGDGVVSRVLAEIADPAMPKRRYAMNFLGHGGYKVALSALVDIAEDGEESPDVAATALMNVYRIDPVVGRRLADRLEGGAGNLPRVIGWVRSDQVRGEGRSWLQAAGLEISRRLDGW